jgi:hypothetical protein
MTMPVDLNTVIKIWPLDEIPFCERGAELAREYVISSTDALTNFGMEGPADRITEISTAYMALVEHGSSCPACQEVDSDYVPEDAMVQEQKDDPDHHIGFEAGSAGAKLDTTKSRAWQQGWADAQE